MQLILNYTLNTVFLVFIYVIDNIWVNNFIPSKRGRWFSPGFLYQ